jgi:hypothetical protein
MPKNDVIPSYEGKQVLVGTIFILFFMCGTVVGFQFLLVDFFKR